MQLPYLDPLEAAQLLLDYILGAENGAGTIEELASHIDTFMYALRYLRTDQVKLIQETHVNPPDNPKGKWRKTIATRFPMLGLYWTVASHRIAGQEPQIWVDDAIDDLEDIAREISSAMWYLTNYGREEALAALRFGYEHHLHMHLVALRLYLETEIFEYW